MQTIDYIKNGKEGKRSRIGYSLFGKGVYSVREEHCGKLEYHVSEDIGLLHLKNFKFANAVSFYLNNKDTIFILDHCCFSNKFVVQNGNVSIHAPSYNNSQANIQLIDSEYVELNLEDDKIKNDKAKISRPYEYIITGGKELEITGDASKTLVRVRTDEMSKITLKKLEDPSMFYSHVDEMRIVNTNIKRGFITGRGNNDYKNLYLENSTLYLPGDEINLKAEEQVQVKDTIVKSPLIYLPNGRTYVKMQELEFSSTDENASGNLLSSRLDLISCLKRIGAKAEDKCKKELESSKIEEEYFQLAEPILEEIINAENRIKYYEEFIATSEESLCEIDNSYEQEVNLKQNEFKKQKIKSIIK